MKPASSVDDVLDLLDAAAASASVGAAMELGLFWLLCASPMEAEAIAERLGIPPLRCRYWLEVLVDAGFLERDAGGFRTSLAAQLAVVGGYSQPTWALLAEEAADRFRAVRDLPRRLRAGRSADGGIPPIAGAYERMATDAGAARRFTRMLYEVHLPLAREFAPHLEPGHAKRLMDLGGGSGVMSLELARRYPSLASTVVDLATVCAAGEEIAAEHDMAGRVSFHAADFLRDPLPSGFDIVVECDVNVYTEELFRKVRAALEPAGRYVILDQFARSTGEPAPSRAHWALAASMADPAYAPPSLPGVRSLLERSGFFIAAEWPLVASATGVRFDRNLTVIDARPAGRLE